MSIFDEIERDAKAGTPGPFEKCNAGDYSDYDSECIVIIGDDLRIAVVLGSHSEAEANAHRIARLPQLERIALAAKELADAAKELRDLMNAVYENEYVPDSFTNQPIDAALTAFREATK